MRLPPALGAGARVALVAPAGPLRGPAEVDTAIANASSLGWDTVVGASALARTGYLAGDDAVRARDINAAFADPTIDGVWCLRGGYGTMRILDLLDFEPLRHQPKALLGFSDVTAIHAALGVRCELASYHGPTARSPLSDFSRDSLRRAVIEQRDSCGTASDARIIRPGRAEGRLMGGNLALLAALAGTPYAPDYDDAILLVEDVGEVNFRIDRMLRQLQLSGALGRVAGIAFGHFTDGSDPNDGSGGALDDLLREAAGVAGVPCIAGIPLGHIDDQWTLHLGARAELDADARTLHVLAR